MIIENLGLPGCGKSTVADSLRKENPSSYIKILLKGLCEQDNVFQSGALTGLNPKVRILLIGFWAVLLHPRMALNLLKHILMLGFDIQRFFLGMIIMDRIAKVKRISQSRDNFFLDEGLFQFFGSLAVGSASKKASSNFYKQYLSLHDFELIYHKISPEDSYRRLMNRSNGHTRFEKMNPNEALRNLQLMERQFHLIIEQARSLGIRVLMLDANHNIEVKVQRIKEFIKS